MLLNEGVLWNITQIPFPNFDITIEQLREVLQVSVEANNLTGMDKLLLQVEDSRQARVKQVRAKINIENEKIAVALTNQKLQQAIARKSELQNEMCLLDSHSWTPWLKNLRFANTDWLYKKYCLECGEKVARGENNLPQGLDRYKDIVLEAVWNRLSEDEKIAKVQGLKFKTTQKTNGPDKKPYTYNAIERFKI